MSSPTTDDPLHRAAVDIATDATSLLVAERERVRPEHAYIIAMECVRVADRILRARRESLPWEAAARYEEARTAALRALITLDRAGAHADLPRAGIRSLEGRLHDLALALGAMARPEGA